MADRRNEMRQCAIALIVCTRNRANSLQRALERMGAVLFDQPWELVIVDNGSSDGTSEVVAAFSPPAGCKLVYVREETRGLSHARNRGVRESSAPILVFTDDDCYVEQDYLQEWARAFRDAVVGFGGGRVLLHDPDAPRMTVQDKAVRASIEPMTFLRAGALHGANMAFRRVVFERVGVFDPFLGAGSATNAGEDCDLLTRASLAGFLGVYDPGPTVRHDHGRVSEGDLVAIEHAYDLGRGAYFGKHVASLATLGPAMGCWYRSSRSCARSLAGMKRLARELWGACTYWYIRLTSRNGRSTGGASVKEGGR